MIKRDDEGMFVPSVANPRKQKLILKGRISVWDMAVAIPLIILWIVLILIMPVPWWVNIVTFIVTVGIILVLIWPLGFLGKEKLYIYIIRILGYFIGVRFLRSEEWDKSNGTTSPEKPIKKNDVVPSNVKDKHHG